VEKAARSYVVGSELADAVRSAHFLATQGMTSTICFWDGEGDAPRRVADHYRSVIETIYKERLNCYASVKPRSLQFSTHLCDEVLESACQQKVALHFDSLSPASSQQTLN
jgi:hypothetical protein